jgi:hypothetical protein
MRKPRLENSLASVHSVGPRMHPCSESLKLGNQGCDEESLGNSVRKARLSMRWCAWPFTRYVHQASPDCVYLFKTLSESRPEDESGLAFELIEVNNVDIYLVSLCQVRDGDMFAS